MDKENKDTGHIKDTGGPYENLQAIVKCGTSEFLGKLQDASSAREMSEPSVLIGQFWGST